MYALTGWVVSINVDYTDMRCVNPYIPVYCSAVIEVTDYLICRVIGPLHGISALLIEEVKSRIILEFEPRVSVVGDAFGNLERSGSIQTAKIGKKDYGVN